MGPARLGLAPARRGGPVRGVPRARHLAAGFGRRRPPRSRDVWRPGPHGVPARACLRPRVLRVLAELDRVVVGMVPWFALAVSQALYLALLGAAPAFLRAAAEGTRPRRRGSRRRGGPAGSGRRRCATGPRSAASRGGGWRSARRTPRCWAWPRSAAPRWSPSPSRSPAGCSRPPSWPHARPAAPRPVPAPGRPGSPPRRWRSSSCAGFAATGGRAGRPVTVVAVQGNVPRLGLDFNAQRRAVLDNHVDATIALAAGSRAGTPTAPRPGGLAGELLRHRPAAQRRTPRRDHRRRRRHRRAHPGRRGAARARDRTVRNAGILWDPAPGRVAAYIKRHPVPFAEYVPAAPSSARSPTRST